MFVIQLPFDIYLSCTFWARPKLQILTRGSNGPKGLSSGGFKVRSSREGCDWTPGCRSTFQVWLIFGNKHVMKDSTVLLLTGWLAALGSQQWYNCDYYDKGGYQACRGLFGGSLHNYFWVGQIGTARSISFKRYQYCSYKPMCLKSLIFLSANVCILCVRL